MPYRIADNKTGELAEWDNELLALELEDLRMMNFDLDTLAFDEDEFDRLCDKPKDAPDVKEYDESVADDVEMCECPKCCYRFPL